MQALADGLRKDADRRITAIIGMLMNKMRQPATLLPFCRARSVNRACPATALPPRPWPTSCVYPPAVEAPAAFAMELSGVCGDRS
jgi:hypothetical protein